MCEFPLHLIVCDSIVPGAYDTALLLIVLRCNIVYSTFKAQCTSLTKYTVVNGSM